jgi:hypothetical protein
VAYDRFGSWSFRVITLMDSDWLEELGVPVAQMSAERLIVRYIIRQVVESDQY